MRLRQLGILSGALALAACAATTAGSAPVVTSGPAAVDGERMRAIAAPGNAANWMSHGLGWDEQRYSPLDQINVSNVSRLGLAWFERRKARAAKLEADAMATPERSAA